MYIIPTIKHIIIYIDIYIYIYNNVSIIYGIFVIFILDLYKRNLK